jgi:exonuclease III
MKIEAVKDLLKTESPEILMLQETKIEGEALLDLSRMNWKRNGGKVVSARGTSGGLATVWIEDQFHLESSFETQHWIYTELRHKTSKISIALFNLYVPVQFVEKKECWQTLSDFVEAYSPKNIIIAGDLNIVLEPKEK